MSINKPFVEIEEVESILTPAPGITLLQAVADANLKGYESIRFEEENNCVVITWVRSK